MPEGLRLVLRTPHEVVFDEAVRGARVPTQTGQVGLRPRGEPLVLVVEPGLVLLHDDGIDRFAATAGGLLESGRERCTLYTPAAVVGPSGDEVLEALDRLLSAPDRELAARRQLVELEQRILQELRQGPRGLPSRRDNGGRVAG
jgi:F0F1-type ATP synthase epsilon subunit